MSPARSSDVDFIQLHDLGYSVAFIALRRGVSVTRVAVILARRGIVDASAREVQRIRALHHLNGWSAGLLARFFHLPYHEVLRIVGAHASIGP